MPSHTGHRTRRRPGGVGNTQGCAVVGMPRKAGKHFACHRSLSVPPGVEIQHGGTRGLPFKSCMLTKMCFNARNKE